MKYVMNMKTGEEIPCIESPLDISKKLSKSPNDFAKSLAIRFDKGWTLSDSQWFWFYKLGQEAEIVQIKLHEGFSNYIRRIFDLSSLRNPGINFVCGEGLAKIYKGKSSIRVTGNEFYGRLRDEDIFEPTKECTEQLLDALKEFSKEPMKQAVIDGKKKGICMFCRIELTHAESVMRGYGPICADRYGLEYNHSRVNNQERII